MSRKPGSRNRKFVEATELPAVCPACGSVELKRIEGTPVRGEDIAGEIFGTAYSRIEWHDKRCECGQHVRVRKYLAG